MSARESEGLCPSAGVQGAGPLVTAKRAAQHKPPRNLATTCWHTRSFDDQEGQKRRRKADRNRRGTKLPRRRVCYILKSESRELRNEFCMRVCVSRFLDMCP